MLNKQISAYCRTEERKKRNRGVNLDTEVCNVYVSSHIKRMAKSEKRGIEGTKTSNEDEEYSAPLCFRLTGYFDFFDSLGRVIGDVDININRLSMVVQLERERGKEISFSSNEVTRCECALPPCPAKPPGAGSGQT